MNWTEAAANQEQIAASPFQSLILLLLCVKDLNLSSRDLGFTVFPSTYVLPVIQK